MLRTMRRASGCPLRELPETWKNPRPMVMPEYTIRAKSAITPLVQVAMNPSGPRAISAQKAQIGDCVRRYGRLPSRPSAEQPAVVAAWAGLGAAK